MAFAKTLEDVDWACRARMSPDCILNYGPLCKACEALADDDVLLECKMKFNSQFCDNQPLAQTRMCEGSKSCWEFVQKTNWQSHRCKGYLRAGGPQGCPQEKLRIEQRLAKEAASEASHKGGVKDASKPATDKGGLKGASKQATAQQGTRSAESSTAATAAASVTSQSQAPKTPPRPPPAAQKANTEPSTCSTARVARADSSSKATVLKLTPRRDEEELDPRSEPEELDPRREAEELDVELEEFRKRLRARVAKMKRDIEDIDMEIEEYGQLVQRRQRDHDEYLKQRRERRKRPVTR